MGGAVKCPIDFLTVVSMAANKKLSLKLKKFSFDMMERTDTVCAIAKRKSGKSVLIRDLLHHFQDFPLGTIICPTERLNNDYKPHVPAMFIHGSYREDIIEKVLNRQRLDELDKSLLTPQNIAHV